MTPRNRRKAGKSAVQLRIALTGYVPTIWRRLLVPGEIKLSKVHSIFQAAMGWEDDHLHRFEIGEFVYAPDGDELADDELDDERDEDAVVLVDVIEQPMRFIYLYDFGDDWSHEVIIESIEPMPSTLKFGVCLEGQRACPPEDCGGVGGFTEFLQAMSDPSHRDHDHYVSWIGHPFDPDEFGVAEANARLQRVK